MEKQMNDEKVRENRLRRMADRQGLKLVKSRRRDPSYYDYGAFWLVNPWSNTIEAGHPDFGMSLDEVEAALLE